MVKNRIVTSKNIIALFLAVAVINIYVTDSYCSFTKEIGHPHADLALTEARENHNHSKADEDRKSVEHHHKSLEAEKPPHHNSDHLKSNHHHDEDKTQAKEKHHHNNQEAEEHQHHTAQLKSSHHHEGNETAATVEKHNGGQKSGNHCHDSSQPECDNHHDGKKDGNCCKDNSEAFFSSLINHSVNPPVLKSLFIGIIYNIYSVNELLLADKFSTKGFIIREAPPPKIPDLRIFIQSFII